MAKFEDHLPELLSKMPISASLMFKIEEMLRDKVNTHSLDDLDPQADPDRFNQVKERIKYVAHMYKALPKAADASGREAVSDSDMNLLPGFIDNVVVQGKTLNEAVPSKWQKAAENAHLIAPKEAPRQKLNYLDINDAVEQAKAEVLGRYPDADAEQVDVQLGMSFMSHTHADVANGIQQVGEDKIPVAIDEIVGMIRLGNIPHNGPLPDDPKYKPPKGQFAGVFAGTGQSFGVGVPPPLARQQPADPNAPVDPSVPVGSEPAQPEPAPPAPAPAAPPAPSPAPAQPAPVPPSKPAAGNPPRPSLGDMFAPPKPSGSSRPAPNPLTASGIGLPKPPMPSPAPAAAAGGLEGAVKYDSKLNDDIEHVLPYDEVIASLINSFLVQTRRGAKFPKVETISADNKAYMGDIEECISSALNDRNVVKNRGAVNRGVVFSSLDGYEAKERVGDDKSGYDFTRKYMRIPPAKDDLFNFICEDRVTLQKLGDLNFEQKQRPLKEMFDEVYSLNSSAAHRPDIVRDFVEWAEKIGNNVAGTTSAPKHLVEELEKLRKDARPWFGARWYNGIASWWNERKERKRKSKEDAEQQIDDSQVPEGFALTLSDLYDRLAEKYDDPLTERTRIEEDFRTNLLMPEATPFLDEGSNLIGILFNIDENFKMYSGVRGFNTDVPQNKGWAPYAAAAGSWSVDLNLKRKDKANFKKLLEMYTVSVPYTVFTESDGKKKVCESVKDAVYSAWKILKADEVKDKKSSGSLMNASMAKVICCERLGVGPDDTVALDAVENYVNGYVANLGVPAGHIDRGLRFIDESNLEIIVNGARGAVEGARKAAPAPADEDPVPVVATGEYVPTGAAPGLIKREFCDSEGKELPDSDIAALVGSLEKYKGDAGERVSVQELYKAAYTQPGWRSKQKEAKKTREQFEQAMSFGSRIISIIDKDDLDILRKMVAYARSQYKDITHKPNETELSEKEVDANIQYQDNLDKAKSVVDVLLALMDRERNQVELTNLYVLPMARKVDEFDGLKKKYDEVLVKLESADKKLKDARADPDYVIGLERRLNDYEGKLNSANLKLQKSEDEKRKANAAAATLRKQNEILKKRERRAYAVANRHKWGHRAFVGTVAAAFVAAVTVGILYAAPYVDRFMNGITTPTPVEQKKLDDASRKMDALLESYRESFESYDK